MSKTDKLKDTLTDISDKVKEDATSAAIKTMLKKAYAKLGSGPSFVWKFSGMQAAWCAMFVCWTVSQGFGDNWTKYVPKTWLASIPKSIVEQRNGTWIKKPGSSQCTYTPQPGDIWSRRSEYGGSTGYAHTGLVYSVNVKNKTITTIEGNYSNKVASNTKPWSYYYCIARPKWGTVGNMTGPSGEESSAYLDNTGGIYLTQQIDKLYSSNNYEFIYDGKEEQKESPFEDSFAKEYKAAFQQLSSLNSTNNKNQNNSNNQNNNIELGFSRNNVTGLVPDSVVGNIISKYDYKKNQKLKDDDIKLNTVGGDTFAKKGTLLSSQSLVEAPVIILKLGGKVIGGYGNEGDMYPNYIQSLNVEKISGKINKYTINLVYQVRYGEDPNFIDKLLSMTGFTNKINIIYGDSNYPSGIYRDDEAIVTDVTFNEDVSNKQIKYTITALSSIISSTGKLSTYPSITDKPSNAIRNLLYSNNEDSRLLLDSLSGMKNRTLVDSNGLIPNDDAVVTTQKMINVSTISMLNYYVSGMYNVNTNTAYFYNIYDDTKNEFGGPYIKISQLNETNSNTLNGNYFEVDVGFPSVNFVMGFSVNSDVYFPLVYDYNSKLPEWAYDINNSGELISTQTNPLLLRNNINRPNVIQSTWWNKVTEYPITASLTLKGLTKPVMIGSYIKVNVLFYGNKDLASGLYMITGQTDTVSGSGCRTTLSLVRVGT